MTKYIVLVFSLLVSVNFQGSLYAQQEMFLSKTLAEKDDFIVRKEECLNKFNVDKILSDKKYSKVIKNNLSHLEGIYFQCRGVAEGDSFYNLLDSSGLKDVRLRLESRFLRFMTDLIESANILPRMMRTCGRFKGFSNDKCRGFIRAFKNKDASFCGQDKSCKAYVTLNEKLVGSYDKEAREEVRYLKALSEFDLKECRNIREPALRMACEAYISGDKKICEKYDDFANFKNDSCEQSIKSNQQ